MGTTVKVVRSVRVAVAPRQALEALWHIENIAGYEPKVDRVRVRAAGPRTGTYAPQGRFAGVPWRGLFSYRLLPNGFFSRMLRGPLPGLSVCGGFVVRPRGKGCEIIHHEQYGLPRWLSLLRGPLRAYIAWSMRRELRAVRRLVTRWPAGRGD